MLKLFVLELTIFFFLKILTQVCDDKNNVSFVIENRQNKTRTHTHTHTHTHTVYFISVWVIRLSTV